MRMAQRGLSKADIDYVMEHGRCLHNAGARAYFLGKRDIPKEDLRKDRYRRLEGTFVILDKRGEQILTTYRNKKAPRQFRRRTKHCLRCAA